MDHSEFKAWLEKHVSRFPRLGEWFAKDKTIVHDWADSLSEFTIDDLNFATREMMQSEETIWQEQQLGQVRRHAKIARTRRSFVSKAPVENFRTSYKCKNCRDAGTIRIIAVDPDRFTTFEALTESDLLDCACACTCSTGRLRFGRDPNSERKGLPELTRRAYVYNYDIYWKANVEEALDHYKSLVEEKKHSEFLKFAESVDVQ